MVRTAGGFVLAALPAIVAVSCEGGTITRADDDAKPGPGGGGETGGPDAGAIAGPTVTIEFDGTDEELVNPERGYFRTIDLVAGGDAQRVRNGGHTLAQAIVRLDDYRDRPLDAALLSALRAGLAEVRVAGIKVVLRFAYNDSFDDDAS